jgi:cystathionine beta-synthase
MVDGMRVVDNVLELIGGTPMVKVSHFDTGPCELYLKLELANPGGSIKDRIGLSMIERAEARGDLKPGDTIVEATAGNTGLGLALVAGQKGYKLIIVIPDKMSPEKVYNLKAMDAEVILTRSDVQKGHPEYYQDLAQTIAAERGAYYINQFGNPDNPYAHQTTTAPEILEQMDGDVDAVVLGVGSSGTVSGLTAHFKVHAPELELVLADPEGSVLAGYIASGELGEAGSWLVEGIGEDFIPDICDLSMVGSAYSISDKEAFSVARELLVKEGIQAGSSTGTIVAAALRYCREQTEPKRVVTFACDTGNRYISKVYNENWLWDVGLIDRATNGDLSDLVARPHAAKGTVCVGSGDSLATAQKRMRDHQVSQLPVMDGERIVGMLSDLELVEATLQGPDAFAEPAGSVMRADYPRLPVDAARDDLIELLRQETYVVVEDGGTLVGLITRADLITANRNAI